MKSQTTGSTRTPGLDAPGRLPLMAGLYPVPVLAMLLCPASAGANPSGGTVAQGSAAFNATGSHLTITTSANTYINWQSFNIGANETTTFVEPSATSVVWNQINSGSPSRILGNLNANGYVILQNQSGFYVGGSAAISAHGLIMTTTPTPMPDLSSGGAWSFNAPPPSANIVNYGQITVNGGGPAFLIANDIENNGTISAPGGKIGLYAGEQVLVSLSPDGRGLSARATLPQGSVDNEGHLIADGGTIAIQAQTVNQNGLVQANSIQNVNGEIELVASDSLTLGASSDIEANGDTTTANTTASPGGFVVLQSGNTFNDTAGSQINVARSLGGPDGVVEIFGNNLTDATSVQSQIDGVSASQFGSQDILLVNPYDLTLSSSPTATSTPGPNPNTTDPNIDVNDLTGYTQIDLRALDNIEVSASWSVPDATASACLSLTAGNNITLDDGAGINAGNDWNVNLVAGTGFVPTVAQPTPASGSDGIYINGSADVQTENGNINLWAANEVLLDTTSGDSVLSGSEGIRTVNGGNITVTAEFGDVNTGGNPVGYDYLSSVSAPYYAVDPGVGGISTAAGGNVTITAGGNVSSYLPAGDTSDAQKDGGSGAFGPEPGDVTITAGRSVFGHYVLADGVGSITAGQNVGALNGNPFALSLVDGSWNVNAPNGNIYLQEVRNPNGVFNNVGYSADPGFHYFDYAPQASVDLTAYGVYLTDLSDPRPAGINAVPVLYPPILDITTGAGGVELEGNVGLFPSPYQSLDITTTGGGNLVAPITANGLPTYLYMSDSSSSQAISFGSGTFGVYDHGSIPADLNDPNPVVFNISGDMENLQLMTTKATQITVGGDMINCGFSGQNLHASDVTSITVGGQIFNQPSYSFVTLPQGIPNVPAAEQPPGLALSWANIFTLALNPSVIASLQVPANLLPSQLYGYVLNYANASLFGYNTQTHTGHNPGFTFNPATGQLGFNGPMAQSILSELSQPVTVLVFGANGLPLTYTENGATYFQTTTVSWAAPSAIQTLFTESQGAAATPALGYRLGGPGQFDVDAGSISLGDSYGILSCGVEDPNGGLNRYNNLASVTPSGASINVTVAGDLDMLTSTIASLGGGNVTVASTGGSLDLGTGVALSTSSSSSVPQVSYGVYSAGSGNVSVTALGDVDIDGSRIASYDGGNIFVESLEGNVDVGSGGNSLNGVYVTFVNSATGKSGFYSEDVFGSGIVANTLLPPQPGQAFVSGEGFPPDGASLPGNITVETPRGDITASLGGITQEALNGNVSGGPVIDLAAGTPAGPASPGYGIWSMIAVSAGGTPARAVPPGYSGNVDLGQSGAIGGTINIYANGNISGLVIARQSTTITAVQNFNGSVLAGGAADVSGGGTVSGTIVGVGGASVTGGDVTAAVLSQNATVNGGLATSTLGATASATTASQSGANQASASANQAMADNSSADNEKNKKKKLPLVQRSKRVTVLLPGKT